MLGTVPLLLVKDYLSIAYSSHFSVLLGLVLFGIVFFIPDGIIGLLRKGRAAIGTKGLANALEAAARRLRGAPHPAAAPSVQQANGAASAPARPAAAPRHPAGKASA